jgi:PIN domain nuclease of toxin-antitoxin system
LLDTHVVLWSSLDTLSEEDRGLLAREAETVFVSAASVWEIEIKRATGRLRAPEDVVGMVHDAGFTPLPIGFEHAVAAGRLPLHHRDPFDRMLIAQARVEGLTLATSDPDVSLYDVATHTVARA